MMLLLLCVMSGLSLCGGVVRLNPVSTLYLPYLYDKRAEYDIHADAAVQSSYDPSRGLVYTVGYSGILHVIDVSNVKEPHIIYKIEFHDMYQQMATDVQICGNYVAVTLQHKKKLDNGHLLIFTPYNKQSQLMMQLRKMEIGVFPNQLVFTKNCRTIMTANEGRLTKFMHAYKDAEGTISIIKFDTDDLGYGPFRVNTLDFTAFNDRSEEYQAKGVRYLYSGLEQTDFKSTFSQDMEPEYITINADETKAYICLQENNAVAVVDIATETIIDIYPLGVKDWSQYKLDASDADKKAELFKYNVYGMYQPDNIKFFVWDGVEYIVSANEGDGKAYKVDDHGITWSEAIRGSVFTSENLLAHEVDDTLAAALRDQLKLGNLVFSFKDGEIIENSLRKFNKFYTYGGRSFSLWRASDLSLVYDSGSEVEELHMSSEFSTIFNSHVESETHTPTFDIDTRSDDKGPEPETLEVVEISDKMYFFIGNERTSTIMIYSMERSSTTPKFESMHRSGFTNATWRELYDNRHIGDIDPEDLLFIPHDQSPNCKPLLLVTGSVSGTVSFYEVTGLPDIPNKQCMQVTPEGPLTTKTTVPGTRSTVTTPRTTIASGTTSTTTTTRRPTVTDRHDASSSNPSSVVTTSSTTLPSTTVLQLSADLVFIIDASSKVGVENFNRIKQFIQDSLLHIRIGRQYTRVAIVTYSSSPHIRISLNQYTTYNMLINAINELPYEAAKGRDLLDAFKVVRTEILSAISERDARKTIIVITNGRSDSDPVSEAQLLKDMGAMISVIAVKSDTLSTREISDISSFDRLNKVLESFADLDMAKDAVNKAISAASPPTTPQTAQRSATSTEKGAIVGDIDSNAQQTTIIGVSVAAVVVALAVIAGVIGFVYWRNHGGSIRKGPNMPQTFDKDQDYVTFENETSSVGGISTTSTKS